MRRSRADVLRNRPPLLLSVVVPDTPRILLSCPQAACTLYLRATFPETPRYILHVRAWLPAACHDTQAAVHLLLLVARNRSHNLAPLLLLSSWPCGLILTAPLLHGAFPILLLQVEGDKAKLVAKMGSVVNNANLAVVGPTAAVVGAAGAAEAAAASSAPGAALPFRGFLRRYGRQLLGCAMAWFLLDVAFYSQNLFQKDVFTVRACGVPHATATSFCSGQPERGRRRRSASGSGGVLRACCCLRRLIHAASSAAPFPANPPRAQQINWIPAASSMNALTETFKTARAQCAPASCLPATQPKAGRQPSSLLPAQSETLASAGNCAAASNAPC